MEAASVNHLKPSRYLAAGAPKECHARSCRKPFEQTCFHGEAGNYYCSRECAEAFRKVDLSNVTALWQRRA
jgi:hypothetical protein